MTNVFVVYKLNRYSVKVDIEQGIKAKELLIYVCAKLSLNPERFHLLRNNNYIKPEQIIFPFTRVELCADDPITKPSVVKCLWTIAQEIPQEEALRIIARELFEEVMETLQIVANYGLYVCKIDLNDMGAWRRAQKYFGHPDLIKAVLRNFKSRCHEEELYYKQEGDTVLAFQWKLDPADIPMVLITTRDLIQLGHSPASPRLFVSILNRLRGAIIEGIVASDVKDAQLNWVRKNF